MPSQAIIQISTDAEIKAHAVDVSKEKEIITILNQTYPGYLWSVKVHRLIADIFCLNLSGKQGMRGDLSQIYSGSELKRQVVMMGGEMLERYRQSRKALRQDILFDVERDFKGDLALDV